MVSAMKTSVPLINYFILAIDPKAVWRNVQVDVRASSRDEAERIARTELVRSHRDDWSIDLVLEAA